MKTYVGSMGIILLFLLLGELTVLATKAVIPGSIIGMILLLIGLQTKLIPLALVKPAADFLLSHLNLFFVPAGVGLINFFPILQQNWLLIVAASLISTIIVLLLTGWVAQQLSPKE